MLLIRCPWCGDRNETEFHYGGQAHVPYPPDPHALDDQQWGRYLFVRDNPSGEFTERWSHSAGCRRWFTIRRNTVTNELAPDQAVSGDPVGESPGYGAEVPAARKSVTS